MKWTPKDNPTTNEINNNHLFPLGLCMSSSHLSPNQKSIAISNDDKDSNKESQSYNRADFFVVTSNNSSLKIRIKKEGVLV